MSCSVRGMRSRTLGGSPGAVRVMAWAKGVKAGGDGGDGCDGVEAGGDCDGDSDGDGDGDGDGNAAAVDATTKPSCRRPTTLW